jgi:hypothetical protein
MLLIVDVSGEIIDAINGFQVPYVPYLATQFSIAYDAYLEICRCLKNQVNVALGLDTAQLCLKQSCLCCFNKLEDKPELDFSCFVSVDGNNSLKCLRSSVHNVRDHLDSCMITSDCWISIEEVDCFKDEVPRVSI